MHRAARLLLTPLAVSVFAWIARYSWANPRMGAAQLARDQGAPLALLFVLLVLVALSTMRAGELERRGWT